MDGALALPRYGLRDVDLLTWGIVAALGVLLFAVAYEQGALIQLVLGQVAQTNNYLHELFHDGRHLLGFPCH